MNRVVALVDDLFFASKMLETARQVGVELKTAATAGALLDLLQQSPATLVVVDLNARQAGAEAIAQLRAAGCELPVIAFLSHVQTELAERARAAGCTQVLPRSRFTRELADIFRSAQ